MAINTLVTKKSTSKYPKLMTSKDDGYVYLFISDGLAVPLNHPEYIRTMDIEDVTDWNTENFKEFDGSITLSN